MRLLLAVSLLLVSCSYSITNDYIDFVKANGIEYISVDYFGGGAGVGRALVEADLGPEHFRVKQMLSRESKGPDYRTADGDSAFVPAGDPMYSLKGYATTFRLAARRDGKLVLYEADSNPAAKTGRDLLDIEGRVVGIALMGGKDGPRNPGPDHRPVADRRSREARPVGAGRSESPAGGCLASDSAFHPNCADPDPHLRRLRLVRAC